MPLNKSKGNMYSFITHTFNMVKGACPHDCSYCYMKQWGQLNPPRFDIKELNTDLGNGNFIFVGSSCDMFADIFPNDWILQTIKHCSSFDNKYLFQTKNPGRINDFLLPPDSVICTTIETNRWIPEIMKNSPEPYDRSIGMFNINLPTYVTIEPIIDFDLDELLQLIENCHPIQVNIGADSKKKNLPEPSKNQILQLITELEKFTLVKQKDNLKRLLA